MQLTTFIASLMLASAPAVQARFFTLYDDINYGGQPHAENRPDGATCCTLFLCLNRDCQGSSWQQRGDAPTVPAFLNDHIWSYANRC
ncbi:hypothetical protein SMACR_09639 [Sordaria macrospora]|uniref:WGS project CABT00000000 data, contig 2.133 n=2 Tax=Sordaria macrospora TaxID=5147 RepID=F7WCH0_SORMK|nr:uncharacterized protein SMAC_09639 [Sordaria macrospora k-hell]KAA8628899.1 hypothetical protein SMACR_09639 [Sordaria macrospora]WPJ57216.1 hypothetical protein SMAC4_09639 [Sordaria macrospora]CCC05614.1 unnamed protein product [Sordaria macrospora k-hell]